MATSFLASSRACKYLANIHSVFTQSVYLLVFSDAWTAWGQKDALHLGVYAATVSKTVICVAKGLARVAGGIRYDLMTLRQAGAAFVSCTAEDII